MINNENKGLGRMRFSLVEIYQEIVNEVLDFKNIKTYQLNPNFEGFDFELKLPDDTIVPVYIYIEPVRIGRLKMLEKFNSAENIVNFGFEIGSQRVTSQLAKTNYTTYIRIIATVGKALNKYIDENNPDIITLFSESKSGGKSIDPQKDNIYFAALDRNPIPNYELENVVDVASGKKGLMLYNTGKFK